MEDSIILIVRKILVISVKKDASKEAIDYLNLMSKRTSNHRILGKVFGYSISNYAIAALYWLGTEDSISLYNEKLKLQNDDDQDLIQELIKWAPYKEFI